ncbi:Na+/H+ antiporter NhaA [Actinoplanes subtropicus]|uniref:Na+/H+ antiporter NhaA n=1 Tax=Actinoplanes subtropicus TaxID=543632 RepID=UPI000AE2C94D|nr:Na+/H+ antiporter NhaA [Actinoplanes subtropicus]
MPGPRLFARAARREARRIAAILRTETTGGLLMLGATGLALVWANSPWAGLYREISGIDLLGLTLARWAADGLLAIFFFVAGLELKREFVAGDLRDPRRAVLPAAAAVGGIAAPALIYALINAGGALRGWAVPTATDIAFALAVLGLVNTSLPAGLRTFLLTLAVVDDLLAIVIIAFFYTSSPHVGPLLLALVPLGIFAWLARRRARAWWLLLPLAVATWALVHESGIHPTVAGVLLAFVVPVKTGVRYEHRWRPISAGVAVPVFAFFAAGVSVTGSEVGVGGAVTLGVVAGLVAGKTIGITGATWLVQRFTRAELDGELDWWDVTGMAMLGGVGFTVSLLIGELAFGAGSPSDHQAKLGVLLGSSVAALLGAGLLRVRDRHYRRLLDTD